MLAHSGAALTMGSVPLQRSGRISVAPVKRMAKLKGIKNASQLAEAAGITKPTALRYWRDDPKLFVYDSEVLASLADYFECQPGDLVEWRS
jgi:DNA-binding Xre family transcriptional regulator